MDPRVKQLVKRFRIVKLLVGAKRARDTRLFRDWWRESILTGDSEATAESPSPQKVLLATSLGGWQPGTRLDSVLAMALQQRGAEVAAWLCDEALPACQMADAYFFPDQRRLLRGGLQADMCKTCHRPAADLYRGLGIPLHRLSATLSGSEAEEAQRVAGSLSRDEIPDFTIDGVALGEHALSGALRFYARGDLAAEEMGEAVLRAYLEAAIRTFFSFRRLQRQERFDCVVLHHGIYVPQGTIAELCRQAGVRVATWHPAYRRNCFTFAEGDTYHRAMITEPVDRWQDMRWSPAHEAAIMNYLESRRSGSRDWISFNRDPEESLDRIAGELDLDRKRPWIGLLTTVMWDARLHYPANAFPGVRAWVFDTIRYFRERPDLQLIVRVHPAEVRGRLPARQLMTDEIDREFPELPENVVVIPPDSRISSYTVLENCDAALIYATKMGIELAATGTPTIVAGEAWIRGKGFSLDARDPAEYRALLGRLPLRRRLEGEKLERARKYAFHYFFRRMIPLSFVRQGSSRSLALDVKIDGLDELAPGRDLGLDVICDGILQGRDYIYPAEEDLGRVGTGAEEAEPHQAIV